MKKIMKLVIFGILIALLLVIYVENVTAGQRETATTQKQFTKTQTILKKYNEPSKSEKVITQKMSPETAEAVGDKKLAKAMTIDEGVQNWAVVPQSTIAYVTWVTVVD